MKTYMEQNIAAVSQFAQEVSKAKDLQDFRGFSLSLRKRSGRLSLSRRKSYPRPREKCDENDEGFVHLKRRERPSIRKSAPACSGHPERDGNRVRGAEDGKGKKLSQVYKNNGSFGPDEINVMTAAYEGALIDLSVANRDDPITDLIAKAIVNVTATGERDPILVKERAINVLGVRRPTAA